MEGKCKSRFGGGEYQQIYLRNVKCVMSIRHSCGTSSKHCVYGIFGCIWILKFREEAQAGDINTDINKHVGGKDNI